MNQKLVFLTFGALSICCLSFSQVKTKNADRLAAPEKAVSVEIDSISDGKNLPVSEIETATDSLFVLTIEDLQLASEFDQKWLDELYSIELFDSIYASVTDLKYDAVDYPELPTDTLKARLLKLDARTPFNIEKSVKAENAVILVISIFLYGFIGVITLIGITNIFNTITTNMNLRKKEFAMLKSIGMTKKEFNRMIRLESIFYGVKSLIIGIPIGLVLSYGMYNVFKNSMEMEYVLPYKSIVVAVIFVAVVIGIIMKYSMSKINKQNIIETIRNDNI